MNAEREKATANESLKAAWWFSAARMREERTRSLSLRYAIRSIPLRAATWVYGKPGRYQGCLVSRLCI